MFFEKTRFVALRHFLASDGSEFLAAMVFVADVMNEPYFGMPIQEFSRGVRTRKLRHPVPRAATRTIANPSLQRHRSISLDLKFASYKKGNTSCCWVNLIAVRKRRQSIAYPRSMANTDPIPRKSSQEAEIDHHSGRGILLRSEIFGTFRRRLRLAVRDVSGAARRARALPRRGRIQRSLGRS